MSYFVIALLSKKLTSLEKVKSVVQLLKENTACFALVYEGAQDKEKHIATLKQNRNAVNAQLRSSLADTELVKLF